MKVSPVKDQLVISNHRNELLLLDFKKETFKNRSKPKKTVRTYSNEI